jgi:hypothetical protein
MLALEGLAHSTKDPFFERSRPFQFDDYLFPTFFHFFYSTDLQRGVTSGRLNVVKVLKRTNQIVSFERTRHMIGL